MTTNWNKTKHFNGKCSFFCDFWHKKVQYNQCKNSFKSKIQKTRHTMKEQQLLETKAFIPNNEDPLIEQPWLPVTQRIKKEWIAKNLDKMIKLEP